MNETPGGAIISGVQQAATGATTTDRRGAVPAGTSEEAFAALTGRHLDSAYRLAWAILGDTGEADDATQDAFALAWRNRRSLRDPSRFDAWFGRILINVCRQRLRARSRGRLAPLFMESEPAVADVSQQMTARDSISQAMAALDPDHRLVVVLRYWADLSIDEIAARLGVPAGTVKSRLHYALRSMRPRLEDVP
jgi:RNA polymerase sigma-70 factor, ECF subfamily